MFEIYSSLSLSLGPLLNVEGGLKGLNIPEDSRHSNNNRSAIPSLKIEEHQLLKNVYLS